MVMEIDYSVVKANDLIRRASYDLSATEQKLLLYIISKIKPDDTAFQEYTFRMVELLDVLGLDGDKKSRDQIKDGLRKMRKKEVHIRTATADIYCGWINSPSFSRGYNQTVSVKIDDKLMPYLLDLSAMFTIYELRQIMAMKGKYSIRLYEILKSYEYKGGCVLSLDGLKSMMNCSGYCWRDLKRDVLDPAMKEINLMTDIKAVYKPMRTSRTYTDLSFTINRKDTLENFTAQTRQNMVLYGY